MKLLLLILSVITTHVVYSQRSVTDYQNRVTGFPDHTTNSFPTVELTSTTNDTSTGINPQGGVYLTFQDYKEGKLTDPSNDIKITGAIDLVVKIKTPNGVQKYKGTDIWGYRTIRDGVPTDFRVFGNLGHAIYSKGKIWVYLGPNQFFRKNDKTVIVDYLDVIPFVSLAGDKPAKRPANMDALLDFINAPSDFRNGINMPWGCPRMNLHSWSEFLNCYNVYMATQSDQTPH